MIKSISLDEKGKIYWGDCKEVLKTLDSNSVDIIITSPPYWNQKEYSFWLKYQDYLDDVKIWLSELHRILSPGRHCFWVIPDKIPYPPKENGTKERIYLPIYADTEKIASDIGFFCKFPIIWKKPHGTQKMFGSYPYPPTIIHTPMTERICVWRKGGKYPKRNKETKEKSKFTKEEWVDFGQDLWEIRPETSSDHPAPFPEELVSRIITLWSFVGDMVLDPFLGSGTTGAVAVKNNRKFIGIDYLKEYVKMSYDRINEIA